MGETEEISCPCDEASRENCAPCHGFPYWTLEVLRRIEYAKKWGMRKLSENEVTSYDNKCAHCTCTKASCENCASCKTLPSCLFTKSARSEKEPKTIKLSKSMVYGIHDHMIWEDDGPKIVKELSPADNRPPNVMCLGCRFYIDELCHALTEPPFKGYTAFKPPGPPDELDVCDFYKEMKKNE